MKSPRIILLDILAEEIYGEFGFETCDEDQKLEILKEYEKL